MTIIQIKTPTVWLLGDDLSTGRPDAEESLYIEQRIQRTCDEYNTGWANDTPYYTLVMYNTPAGKALVRRSATPSAP